MAIFNSYVKLPEGNNPRINQGNPPVMQILGPGTKPGRFTMEATSRTRCLGPGCELMGDDRVMGIKMVSINQLINYIWLTMSECGEFLAHEIIWVTTWNFNVNGLW